VARAQKLRNRDTGDGAATLPEIKQALTKRILADALNAMTLGLGDLRQTGRPPLKAMQQFIGERPAINPALK